MKSGRSGNIWSAKREILNEFRLAASPVNRAIAITYQLQSKAHLVNINAINLSER
jgi:hypothetical protein